MTLSTQLRAAMLAHDEANNTIGKLRIIADKQLKLAKLWPDKTYIGNMECIRLLEQLEAKGAENQNA